MNDNDPPLVWIITGRVTRRKGGAESQVHVILRAPDDDSAVRLTLEALQREGFAEADSTRSANCRANRTRSRTMSAYQGALEGEVSIVLA